VPAANALIVAHRAALETLADENALPMERRADARRLLDQLDHPLNAQPF
jgi:uncharacterized protein (DUF1778 family)